VLAKEEKEIIKGIINRREGELLGKYGMVVRDGRVNLIADRVVDGGFDIHAVYEEIVSIDRQIRDYEESFFKKHGIEIEFDEGAVVRLTELALGEGNSASLIFQGMTENFEHGFKLIRDHTKESSFLLTADAIDDPEGYLNKLIKDSYTGRPPLLTGRTAKDGE
jgi:hypothetical protein